MRPDSLEWIADQRTIGFVYEVDSAALREVA
jgi:hypothetical protein